MLPVVIPVFESIRRKGGCSNRLIAVDLAGDLLYWMHPSG